MPIRPVSATRGSASSSRERPDDRTEHEQSHDDCGGALEFEAVGVESGPPLHLSILDHVDPRRGGPQPVADPVPPRRLHHPLALKLEDAGCIDTEKTGSGPASRTNATLTQRDRTALDAYTAAPRDLIAGL